MESKKLGLVLSGGGAKGAYQAGVIRYLAEVGIRPDVVAGASIGALNGAIVSTSRDMTVASQRLDEIWRRMAAESPLRLNKLNMSVILLRTVLHMYGGRGAMLAAEGFNRELAKILPEPMKKLAADPAFLDNQPVRELLLEFVDTSSLKAGLPFWLSLYPSAGAIKDMLKVVAAILGVSNTSGSEFVRVQDLRDEDVHNALLASAAIPLAFEAKEIGGTAYCDGGVGGWWEVQGNAPAAPLVEKESCTHLIVTHLQDGSLWDRGRFKTASVLEIRPSGIGRNGLLDMFAFEQTSILQWMDQGYEDAARCVEPVREALQVFHAGRVTLANAAASISDMQERLSWIDREG